MTRMEELADAHDAGLLAAYVEGRLDDAERSAFTAHLAACPECRQALAMMARAPGLRPAIASRRMAVPVWLGVAAAAILATVAVRQAGGPEPGDVAVPPPIRTSSPVPTEAAPVPVAPPKATVPAEDPLADPGLLVKRGGAARTIGGRSFHLRAGEWVDAALDPGASLPVVRVKGRADREAIAARVPALAPYLVLGDRVVVIVDGTVYRFSP
jgi:anti-sigma factor RsiW